MRMTLFLKDVIIALVVQNVDDGVLGGLAHLPGCRELLIRKHFVELERVMRLCRALVQQMKNQVNIDPLSQAILDRC